MINFRKSFRGNSKTTDINITPLIDMVFILLIFFVVTTSFVKETGVDINRPTASTAVLKGKGAILVAVNQSGQIFMENKQIDIRSLRAHIERSLSDIPEGTVVIIADKVSYTGIIIRVMDQCRLAGAKKISIAASVAGIKG